MKRLALFFLLLTSLGCVGNARAVMPETGLYWNPETPGLGWYIEAQGARVFAIAYAYDAATGAPLFYTTSGPIIRFEDATYRDGYNLGYKGTLYRYEKGPCITCYWTDWETTDQAVSSGAVTFRFLAHNAVMADIAMNDGSARTQIMLERFKLGRAVYDLPYIATDALRHHFLSDLRGVWLFTQPDVEDAAVWRFHFTVVESDVQYSGLIFNKAIKDTSAVVFRDPTRNAELVCTSQACGLVRDGVTIASFYYGDVAEDSMAGYAPPADPEADYQTGNHVIGLRVPDLTPELPGADADS